MMSRANIEVFDASHSVAVVPTMRSFVLMVMALVGLGCGAVVGVIVVPSYGDANEKAIMAVIGGLLGMIVMVKLAKKMIVP